jgi:flagellar biosynthesis protein FlhB
MADDSDRVIPATPRRREDARRRGMMPTAAVPAWVVTAATATMLLPAWSQATLPAAAEFVRVSIRTAGGRRADWPAAALTAVIMPTVAVVLAAALAGLAVRLALDGFTWQPARLLPSLCRIDPLAGLARIASWRTVRTAIAASLGLATLAVAGWFAIRPLLAVSSRVIGDDAVVIAGAWRAAAWLFAAAGLVAGVRWLAARRDFEARIRMTPDEFAEEARSSQADPKVRLLRQQAKRQPTAGAA